MPLVQIRMKDRVLARTLEILLAEKKVSVSVTDKKETEMPESTDLVITDLASADRDTLRFESTVFICGRDETPPENRLSFKRPFLTDAFLSETLGMIFSEEKEVTKTTAISIDKRRKAVRLGKITVPLTDKEFLLFTLLYEKKEKVVTNEEITATVFEGKTVENSNVSAVYVNYLRKKLDERLGKPLIFSVRGKGYMLKIG